jgi:hypothetical protein
MSPLPQTLIAPLSVATEPLTVCQNVRGPDQESPAPMAFIPATGSEADWNAAFYRVEDYLRALGIVNKLHQSQIILGILKKAAVRHASDSRQNPTTLAMEETRAAVNQWFEGILGSHERIGVVGVISMLVVHAPEKWPGKFLSSEVPEDLRQAMRDSDVRSGPDLEVSSMVPRPIDVNQLLDPIHFVESFGSSRPAMTVVAAFFVLAALSVSLYWLIF